MCTVTFIPANNKYYITSNRDEKIIRQPAVPPCVYETGGIKLLYPKDAVAGGTWIGMHENGNAAVLLNGAFQKHLPEPPYKKSRGVVLLEILGNSSPLKAFLNESLLRIEPFTLIIFANDELHECRWDGIKKHTVLLKKSKAYIWSSATLYDRDIIQKRENWFIEWMRENPSPSQQEILHFHQFAGEGDNCNDLLMSRDNILRTVSVTNIELCDEKGSMHYIDLCSNKQYNKELLFSSFYIA